MSGRVVSRLAVAVGVFVALYVAFAVLDFEPHAGPLLLVVVVGVAAAGLVLDGLGGSGPSWRVSMVRPATPPGQDRGLALHLRSIEHHLTADTPDAGLRDRLARLAEQRLAQRHGVTTRGPERDALLGHELVAVLDGPVRRLGRAELTRCIERIEQL